jgi:hypothetical protein
MKHLLALGAIVAAFLIASHSTAVTVISVTGPVTGVTGLGPNQTLATSWIQSDAFANVSINATLGGLQGTGTANGIAYLMNSIGPSTTVANQIASAPFTSTDVFTDTNLFSGLSLPAGTYYLVLHSENNAFWDNTSSPTTTAAPGVSANGVYIANNNNIYPPSDTFVSDTRNFLFSVTGSAVPEPATSALLALGAFLGVAGVIRRK